MYFIYQPLIWNYPEMMQKLFKHRLAGAKLFLMTWRC